MAKSVCCLSGEGISGVLRITQTSEDAPTIIEGEMKGLSSGKHAISINVYGDLSDVATSCGGIFNPFGKNHGAPEDAERMVGDLGNLTVAEGGKCIIYIQDAVVKLIGPHSVIGRSIVIYATEDDCGRGGHELSLTTGNSGARVAAGVIGIASE
eukprot:CAMPEP_0195518104 /NCGR_PEP_ID=MMETSP0794_2-20130614/12258_1 /TAXON_ID=515487 /ORGANISM="Stephanopyxis turris, Strain CCMP 815" /LENGTH=153 /DNA_ID=CAMNT_0040647017 /DNA_START=61 /DNA_END=522 /DNA_ORIENTATION=-